MIRDQIAARGVRAPRVLAAVARVPRHLFVPPSSVPSAHDDNPLVIAEQQTISQPYIVALMTETLALRRTDRVLEIGTGSGYQTALLAELAREVCTVERLPALAAAAEGTLGGLGYRNIRFRVGDGSLGWPDGGPFDAIVVTAAVPEVPPALLAQLAPGGRLVAPVGKRGGQTLVVVERRAEGLVRREEGPVRFVPLIGRDGFWR